jgi:hypothetical protein
MDRNVVRTAVVMTLIMAAEAWPLGLTLRGPHGEALVAQLLDLAGTPLAWAAATAVALAYGLTSMAGLPLIRKRLFDLTGLKLLALPFALVTGLFEELFFRRGLMDWVAGQGLDPVVQIAVSALTFGAAHAVWGLFSRNLRGAAHAMLFTGALGGALAVVYLLAGRQVAPCAAAHVAINLVLEPWLILAYLERARPSRQTALA